ncbi:MAG TPA: deoxyribodipyrimidine photo-lyase [Phycisphaerae bacterium]|nr:deoxyribodipyrimidine photo-lyase [Phycisphaerae bacterium]HNU44369.1 deoxyribodipyrimidine photo-lyase [Phycisphaerae bacterium]
MRVPPVIVWFRLDLRVADHAGLVAAAATHAPVLPVYVWAPQDEGDWAPGSAARWWLHHSLRRLDGQLRSLGSRLLVRAGRAAGVLATLARESRAGALFFHRRIEPDLIRQETAVQRALADLGVAVHGLHDATLFLPEELRTRGGEAYRVYTPFWRACRARREPAAPLRTPSSLTAPRQWPHSLTIDALGLLPRVDWTAGLAEAWQPGAEGARRRLRGFLRGAARHYATGREQPGQAGTSRLSPHLHFGEVSVRTVWHAVRKRGRLSAKPGAGQHLDAYLRQLGWREFAYHLLYHFPHTTSEPLRTEFTRFPWTADPRRLRAWQRGETGYPLVDAGLRELWHTGWMHNRARMVVASFLVKHLLISWQEGARWFWDTLVDADLANNTLGWQWAAGCGADAAPYFRIFNPVTQSERFDPQADYLRRWLPELARLPDGWIHSPWAAPVDVLRNAGVRMGETHPAPLVEHNDARRRALAAWRRLRDGTRRTR